MTRPQINQAGGKWPRNTLLDPSVADQAIAMLDEHATALDALGAGGGISPAATNTVSWAGATLPAGGADTATFTWSPTGVLTKTSVVAASFDQGLPAGVVLVANAIAADTVQATFLNLSGAQQTLATGHIRFLAQ